MFNWDMSTYWFILGLALIGFEVLAPGFCMLWIGLAALVTGSINFFLPNLGLALLFFSFAALAIVFTLIFRKFLPFLSPDSDRPSLNDPKRRMLGVEFYTTVPIEQGRGLMKIQGSYWTILGADLPKNTKVKVTKIVDGQIYVTKCEQ